MHGYSNCNKYRVASVQTEFSFFRPLKPQLIGLERKSYSYAYPLLVAHKTNICIYIVRKYAHCTIHRLRLWNKLALFGFKRIYERIPGYYVKDQNGVCQGSYLRTRDRKSANKKMAGFNQLFPHLKKYSKLQLLNFC